MRTLTVQSIKDFQVCERFYAYRYEENEYEAILGRELFAQRFENTLKRVAAFFFYKRQANIVPSYTSLLNRWEKLWFPKEMTAYDLAIEQHEIAHGNYASYSNVAAGALEQFYNTFSQDKGSPVLIDESFLVPVGRDLRLEGRFDLVLRYPGQRYRVIKWSGRQRRPGINSLILDFAALRMAFEHRNESRRSVQYSLYDLASPKAILQSVETRQADLNALYYWASEIGQKEVFVPRRGYTAYCKGCVFDKECAEWNEWPKI